VLSDHIHLILNPENIKEYSKIISSIKHSFSYIVGQVCPTYFCFDFVIRGMQRALSLNASELLRLSTYSFFSFLFLLSKPPQRFVFIVELT
ncbi:hypothetical protein IJ670_03810, partial [bacterium]|nr:hypothetical protein [bacterium]